MNIVYDPITNYNYNDIASNINMTSFLRIKTDISSIKVRIKDYKVINDKVVIVTFADGTTEKAICSPEDTFDLDRAIEICVCKKIFGGTKVYNNTIKDALKQVAAIDKKKKTDAEEAERIAKKKEKDIQRKISRIEKIRQEQIQIQAEAFVKAMFMYDEQVASSEEFETN